MKLIGFLLLFLFHNLAIGQPKYLTRPQDQIEISKLKEAKPTKIKKKSIFPSLVPDRDHEPVIVGQLKGSCGHVEETPGSNDPNLDKLFAFYGNNYIFNRDYFFFSLSQFYKDKKSAPEMKFYKTKDLSGDPSYVLNKDGLKKDNKLICKWLMEYSEENLYKNFLVDCDEAKDLLSSLSEKTSPTSFRKCVVVGVESYEVKNDEFLYKIKIDGEGYFLDTSEMPRLKSGEGLVTSKKRGELSLIEQSNVQYKAAEMLSKIYNSKGFKELLQCYFNKNLPCVSKVFSKKFSYHVGTSGLEANALCYPSSEECIELKKEQILEKSVKILYSFLFAVLNMAHSSFNAEFFNANGEFIYRFRSEFDELEHGESELRGKLKDGEIYFLQFEDGNSGC